MKTLKLMHSSMSDPISEAKFYFYADHESCAEIAGFFLTHVRKSSAESEEQLDRLLASGNLDSVEECEVFGAVSVSEAREKIKSYILSLANEMAWQRLVYQDAMIANQTMQYLVELLMHVCDTSSGQFKLVLS